MKQKKLGVIMDPLDTIHPEKDSTLVLLLEAQNRGYEIYAAQQTDLILRDDKLFADMKIITVKDNIPDWYHIKKNTTLLLTELNLILMRKDPPVNKLYLYTTQLLEHAEKQGVKIINKPKSLRDLNEKLAITWFPQCCAPTLVSASAKKIHDFLNTHQDIILKPLDGMGGQGIYRLRLDDPNINVTIETVSHKETRFMMAQRYIPEIRHGDKRVILFHGEAYPYAISRIALKGETRANLAAGGNWIKAELTARDKWICAQVGPVLKQKGILFAGLDIIGDYLTEINITSPTCLRQIDTAFGVNSAAAFFDGL
jgi:glutathione synthase